MPPDVDKVEDNGVSSQRRPPKSSSSYSSPTAFSYTVGCPEQPQVTSTSTSNSSSVSGSGTLATTRNSSRANAMNSNPTNPGRIELTVDATLLSTLHSRQRRQERNISKHDLKLARRYGMEDHSAPSSSSSSAKKNKYLNTSRNNNSDDDVKKYVFGGKVFIYNSITNQEITCYPSMDYSSNTSGTKVTKPIRLEKIVRYDTPDAQHQYETIRNLIFKDQSKWTSHSVLVIDNSGSMRCDDVNGGRCRSDAVWLVLARDFVQKQLQTNTATEYDVVSVILMNEDAEAKLVCYPVHWYLYNLFLEYREWKTIRPQGHGNYMPALQMAEKFLNINTLGTCALSLLFFSDGRPSDHGEPFAYRMGQIASKFGRRLNVVCVGMMGKRDNHVTSYSITIGQDNNDNDDNNDDCFKVLTDMVNEAEKFGSIASFNRPNLSTDSLSHVVSSLVSSLRTSKTEMTSVRTGFSRSVRVDLRRERKGEPDDLALNDNWDAFYSTADAADYIPDIWTWDYRKDKFVTLMDPRCVGCYQLVGNEEFTADETKGYRCPGCKACFFCHKCITRGALKKHCKGAVCPKYARDRRNGHFLKENIPSWSMAIKKLVYGEGAERIVYKVRFLNEQGWFFGPKMVAKESRFLESIVDATNDDDDNYSEKLAYHEEFARTQTLASEFADKYNAALDNLVDHFDDAFHPWLKKMPRMRFLKPLVLETFVGSESGKTRNILIEEQLEGDYTKFNNNMGFVRGHSENDGVGANEEPGKGQGDLGGVLDVIAEGSEEEDESGDEDDGLFRTNQAGPEYGQYNAIRDEDFPQAFSHFTYEKSKKQLMVVDLQGIFRQNPDGTSEYVLTDPAIHKRKRSKRSKKLAGWSFGRTDRGEKGMKAFFDTHECKDACRLLGLENMRDRKL